MKSKKAIIILLAALLLVTALISLVACNGNKNTSSLAASYSFDETSGVTAKDSVSGAASKIKYVFSPENQATLFKEANEPLRRKGVKGNALYFDGYTTSVSNPDFTAPKGAITISAWVAPRVFENLPDYDGYEAAGHPRLTAVVGKGDINTCEGFLLGYGRLGLWGAQFALTNSDGDELVVGYYDPINTLPLYEWSHLAVTFDGSRGYVALYFNGERVYETINDEIEGMRIISAETPLYIGKYTQPILEYGVERQCVGGLLDEVKIYSESLTPAGIKELYKDTDTKDGHPALDFDDIALDSSILASDRYRPQYHAMPPAMWMNEPHAPIYFNGKFHVFYQHNPAGPYWQQLRWGHIVSDDMIHWEYVKDAVVPTAGICPEGVWTGGSVIGPDGAPWLVITAGTNTANGSGQNVAYAHPVDPTDPYLTDWTVEDKVAIAQPGDGSQGEVNQFRDPFIWKDGDVYYMLVSTSVPGAGGTANIYVSEDMRDWDYQGYLYEPDYATYPQLGEHWECVIMLPVSTKSGNITKYALFMIPQYAAGGEQAVDTYYWIGTFDKSACRFIPDNEDPQLFDYGNGIFSGQNGFCYLTEEDIEQGKTYEQGRSVLFAIAQGKDAGTAHNIQSGWAHNFAMPLDIWLSDDGNELLRAPIAELDSLEKETLYELEGDALDAETLNGAIANVRGDMLKIEAEFDITTTAAEYAATISVRVNQHLEDGHSVEHTDLIFANDGVHVDRMASSIIDYVTKTAPNTCESTLKHFKVTILLDRSMVEIYINDVICFTTRIYPKYADSDHISISDGGAGLSFTSFKVTAMGSAYSDSVTPAYYGNVESLG